MTQLAFASISPRIHNPLHCHNDDVVAADRHLNTHSSRQIITNSPQSVTLRYTSKMTYKPSIPSQADLGFGLSSDFISRFMQAGLQVFNGRGYDLDHPG